MAEGRDYSISVLDCALRALEELLVADGQGLGLSVIAVRLGLNKSRAFRILATLEQQGFVIQDTETKNYRLGLKLLQFGEAVRQSLHLSRVAAPLLDQLAEATGETVFLGVIDGSEAVCIAKRESKHPVQLYAEIGRRSTPVGCRVCSWLTRSSSSRSSSTTCHSPRWPAPPRPIVPASLKNWRRSGLRASASHSMIWTWASRRSLHPFAITRAASLPP